MMFRTLCSFFFLLALTACQNRPATTDADNFYLQQIAALPEAAQLPPYAELYQSYLQSPAVFKTSADWLSFQQLLTKNPEQCQQLPWQQQLPAQFWNLTFYQQALQCFANQPASPELKRFRDYQQYVINGVLQSGNGKANYSAYQLNSYFDAHEIVRLLDMQTVDFYAELSSDNNALHYVFQVYDYNSRKFRTLYFENQRYLHAIDQIPFPFMGLVDGWKELLLTKSAQANHILLLPRAAAALAENRPQDAALFYQQAIAGGSLQARVKLAEMCYRTDSQGVVDQKECEQQLLQAADSDYVPALHLLHFLHRSGQFGTPDLAKIEAIRKYISELTDAGQAELQLSRYYYNQSFKMKDTEQGDSWLQQAALAGYADAGAFSLLSKREKAQISDENLNQQLQSLAEQGGSAAAYLYASQLMQQPKMTPQQAKDVEKYLLQAVQNYHPEAFYLLAYGYEEGLFGAEKTGQALSYFQSAAERFYPRAMLRLGSIYLEGAQVPKDALRANRWYLLCSKQGNSSCAFNAGVMFDDGDGLPQNHDNAFRFFSYAAERGYAPAINRLALLYLFGKGVEANPEKAIALLSEAASKGSSSASYYLGLLYFEGKVVPQDYPKAKAYFEKVSQHPNARRYLEQWPELTAPIHEAAKQNRAEPR
ncbi:MAG: sel1 repeat family protein [Gammaproteobacteria bacterium]|nr:sel1 repeat family protein [Gammaproteobacteria bacterium]